ncbi:hypothetical protein FEM48_Zijuj12G0169500 [Ziziphus jujuba var. spinosa]|uniref:Uncharacterized protein n=1 Tax=Ziziphus jujuba var. spinosa TaxID=714518 RepID=A0A978UEJ1_ZIZJJ|nr:hypothetical protein FEM48_Zijuj12G0169500 [Ziziphus jujuba var. spinosa]
MAYKIMFMKPLVLFLTFSFILFSAAYPATIGSLSLDMENPSLQGLQTEDGFDLGEGIIERRMDLQSTEDYSGAGANPEHDPKPPGKV